MMKRLPIMVILHAAHDSLTVRMPAARNRWLIFLGFAVGIPWILLMIGGTAAAVVLAPDEMRRNVILGSFIFHVLIILLHVLAVASVWFAFYSLNGTETLEITPDRVLLRRKAMGISIPIKAGRTTYDKVELLDTSVAPGAVPHPQIELRAGHSALRFAAGITRLEAEELRTLIKATLRGMGGVDVSGADASGTSASS